jgi:uncharacterized membrane protein
MVMVRRYGPLLGAIALGAVLRFWHLDGKPLWLDEVITALFSLGRSYKDVPLEQVFPVAALGSVFALHPGTSCAQIAQTIAVQSVHPPLFFCWLHSWLMAVQGWPTSWIWQLRAFPAVVGVVAIAALYQLNRSLFSRRAGLVGAAFMAVSPFAVYLSQEARHYTLPMLFVIFALGGMVRIQSDLQLQKPPDRFWLVWILVNGIGFYIHYFFLLSFIAQITTLVVLQSGPWPVSAWSPAQGLKFLAARSAQFKFLGLAIAAVCLLYAPWLPTFMGHIRRPETDWLRVADATGLQAIAPLYQLPLGWLLMLVAFPIDGWGWLMGVPMVLFALGVVGIALRRLRRLWVLPETQLATRSLSVYVLVVVGEFLAIAAILGKDLTQVPRYNFIYFPAICALLGVSFAVDPGLADAVHPGSHRWSSSSPLNRPGFNLGLVFKPLLSRLFSLPVILLISIMSSGLVVSNVVLEKSYAPDQVAVRVYSHPEQPRLVVMGYQDLQDVALGLSFALAMRDYGIDHPAANSTSQFVFLSRVKGYDPLWEEISQLLSGAQFPLSLWVIAPGLKRKDFRPQISLRDASGTAKICARDPSHYYRLGIPYQRYDCP